MGKKWAVGLWDSWIFRVLGFRAAKTLSPALLAHILVHGVHAPLMSVAVVGDKPERREKG